MKERFTYDQPTCPTATAVVGLSHRGSRVETHAAAANRKIRRREASQCGQPYGGPLGVFAVVEKENGAESIHYILKDHLGSWTTITNANGVVEKEQSFDAWGNPRNPDTWTAYTAPELVEGPMFDRGFTGHEHLNSFGLINMNGRMYDPVMSSFLSVDNYVQAPDFSQSFNRYAYCLNNPLKYTDPTGEKWWHWALADVLSGGFLSSTALVTAEFAVTTVATTGLTAYSMHFPNSEVGYELQKMFSPIAIKFSYGFGSTNHIGVDVSLGMSGAPAYRWHCGASYYFGNNVYGNYNGWETRTGSEICFMGALSYSGTKFKAGNKTQITNKITAQIAPYLQASYENDYMFDIDVLGRYNADDGDRWRTAAVKLKWMGFFEVGTNLYTGDPGHDGDFRREGEEPIYDEDGKHFYYTQLDALNPDERAGVLYVGIGSLRIGWNSEGIRHVFQNKLAHDRLTKGKARWFLPLDIKPSLYFYYGTGTGNTLW